MSTCFGCAVFFVGLCMEDVFLIIVNYNATNSKTKIKNVYGFYLKCFFFVIMR
jgi:hypothetical protein